MMGEDGGYIGMAEEREREREREIRKMNMIEHGSGFRVLLHAEVKREEREK